MKYIVSLNGKDYEVLVDRGDAKILNISDTSIDNKSTDHTNEKLNIKQTSESGKSIDAPLSGIIVQVNVKANQIVKKGETLLILEAMKMENEIACPCDCTISKILCASGSNVKMGEQLIIID